MMKYIIMLAFLLSSFSLSYSSNTVRIYVPENIRYFLRSYVKNTLDIKPEFSPALRKAMRRLLDDDINTIEALLGRPIPAWQN